MAISRQNREYKKKMGQFMTPLSLSKQLVKKRNYTLSDLILEPSFGEGSFLFAIIDRFIEIFNPSNISFFVTSLLEKNIYGVEMDYELYHKTLSKLSDKYSLNTDNISHNLYNSDFFDVPFFGIHFDYIEGNPPFGGSFDESKGIKLDKVYGKYDGIKIKKETYSFFTHRCYNLLKSDGSIGFICSDTFMTIPTMKGVRKILSDNHTDVENISYFSDETDYPMVYFNLKKTKKSNLLINGKLIPNSLLHLTDTLSFSIDDNYEKYFRNENLSKYITCSSGMTVGKNEFFLKQISNGKILETISYEFINEVKTNKKEAERARLGKISNKILQEIKAQKMEEILKINYLTSPIYIDIDSQDYKPYNKASSKKYYDTPNTYIYWKDDGKAVYTFKSTGSWYLHGVGGKKFFEKQGLSWRLISNDIRCRFLPEGYILDSGSPVGILNKNIEPDELYFIIGWLNTHLATKILKTVINHTRNIQSKDIERMPYPYWVSEENKKNVIERVKSIITNKKNTEEDNEFIENLFQFNS
jgi:hypothetical protein